MKSPPQPRLDYFYFNGSSDGKRMAKELLPESRSWQSLGRPQHVAVALQRPIPHGELLAACAAGDAATALRCLRQFHDPNGQEEGERLEPQGRKRHGSGRAGMAKHANAMGSTCH